MGWHNLPSGLTFWARSKCNPHYTQNEFSTNCQNLSEKKKHFSAPTIAGGKDSGLVPEERKLKSSSKNSAELQLLEGLGELDSAEVWTSITVFFLSETIMQGVKTLNSSNVTKKDAISAAYSTVHNISTNYPFMPPRTMVKNTMRFSNTGSVR